MRDNSLKQLAENFAVLVFAAGLMAGGAALYSWLRPQGSEQVTGSTTTLAPLLAEAIVVALFQDFLENPSQDSLAQTEIDQRNDITLCFQQGAKGVRYKEGVWTIHLAGIGCNGLEVFTVDDLTGQVIALAPVLVASTVLTVGSGSPTPTSELPLSLEPSSASELPLSLEPSSTSELTLSLDPALTPGLSLIPRPALSPEHAGVVELIEQYLADSKELDVNCINTAIIEARKGFIPSAATTGIYWSVSAENDYDAQTTWGCPGFHFYEVDDFTGVVRRADGN